MVERFEVTGNPESGKPEMVRSPNPLGGGWVRHSEVEPLVEALREIASCQSAHPSDVVSVARNALKPFKDSQ